MRKYIFEDIKFFLIEHFIKHKLLYLIMGICFLIGIICGIGFTASSGADIIVISTSKYFCIGEKISVGGIFLRRFLSLLITLGILFLVSICVHILPAAFICIWVRGYFFSGLIVLMISAHSFSGVIVVIFVMLPCMALQNAVFIFLSVNCVAHSLNSRRMGCVCLRREVLTGLLFCGIVQLVIIIIECILVALIMSPLLIG